MYHGFREKSTPAGYIFPKTGQSRPGRHRIGADAAGSARLA